ncbi:hypothetical protein M433DRAFT_57957 [Acidomyces richmondensis BFW]|nr:MAG: hypothetical protein FE78DRAFT_145419 [Acidomyces sp. 'richmondensis']KYG50020.1 hypothetical protein M433DRAFT_57957 [Acidomyces richmondensis BFW]
MEGDDELTAEIRAQVEEWSSNSNDCFNISLVRSDGSMVGHEFHPAFTYPIFGDEEAIFGYQDLSINLTFRAHDMRPTLTIEHGAIFKAQGEVRPTDIIEALSDFLPTDTFSDAKEPEAYGEFVPPGEKIHSYSRDGRTYELWCASLARPDAKKMLENMQILVPMFIEGGTILELSQAWTTQRWKLFLLYEVDAHSSPASGSPYSLIGYGTSYRCFTFPDRKNTLQLKAEIDTTTSPLDLPCRERLSQFLIFPPFQGHGYGQDLYNAMYKYLSRPPNVCEFTIEDPNEAFDDLRDLCDLIMLQKHVPEFAKLRINTNIPADRLAPDACIPTDLIVDGAARQRILKQTKLNERQFNRLVEMYTLSFIPKSNRSRTRITRKERSSNENDKTYYFWRLYVKQRLYVFNRDQLAQLEHEERVEKLEAALDSVQEGYSKMLEKVEEKEKSEGGRGMNGSSSPTTKGADALAVKPRKRKVVEDKEDEDEEMDGVETPVSQSLGKKVRTA